MKLPDLPEDSRLRMRATGAGLKVWWRFRPRGIVAGIGDVFLATALLAGGGLAYFFLAVHFEFSEPDWRLTAAMLLIAAIVLGLGLLVFRKFHFPRPESIELSADGLTYALPGDPIADTASVFSSLPELRVHWAKIGTIQVASFGGTPTARLEVDGSFLWVGIRLPETDLEWLVDVLNRWKESVG